MSRLHSLKTLLRAPFVPKLTATETANLQTHITETRTSIFALETRLSAARSNLLTICRCMKDLNFANPASPYNHTIFKGTIGIFDLPYVVCSLEGSCAQLFTEQFSFQPPKGERRTSIYPNDLIERPFHIPENERVIGPPKGLNRAHIAALKMTEEGSYYLLRVKLKELSLETEKVEADVKRYLRVSAPQPRS